MINIPIYRAKNIDSEVYEEGHYYFEDIEVSNDGVRDAYNQVENHFISFGNGYSEMIDPSTLAIHFPSMLDSDGKKIFASLDVSKGIGGDIVYLAGKGDCLITCDLNGVYAEILNNTTIIIDDLFPLSESYAENDVGKVIGIQK